MHTFENFLQIVFLLMFLASLVGLIIPIFPGLQLIWIGMLIYWAIAGIFLGHTVNWWVVGMVSMLMIAGTVIDDLILTQKLRNANTPWYSIIGCYLVGIISGILFTPLIAFLATPLSLFLFEYLRLREIKPAADSIKKWLVGLGWIFMARVGLGVTMILIWSINILLQK